MDYTLSLPSVTKSYWEPSPKFGRGKTDRKILVSHNLPKCLYFELSYHYLLCFVFTSIMVLNISYLRVSSKFSFNITLLISLTLLFLWLFTYFKLFKKNQSLRVRSESMHFTRWKYQPIFIKICQHASIKVLLFPITAVNKTTVL